MSKSRANTENAQKIAIEADGETRVSGLLQIPTAARAGLVLAHGAGAGMAHPFLDAVAKELAERGIATLRYQFLYMEQRSKRPDPPARAHAVVRAAVAEATRRMPDLPLFAGGKSFGGRMTSQAQALEPMPKIRGLVFFGFPLHPAGKPSQERGKHLFGIHIPMLFLQGTKDALADLSLLEPLCKGLGVRATLALFEDAGHSFHAPARTGKTDAAIRSEMLNRLTDWMFSGAR
jgi:uncharacterized protein